MEGHYETCDPIALAVAMHPEVVQQVIEKRCVIETEGNFTKGTVIVDWFERYPVEKDSHRKPVKIVTQINPELMIDLMYQSVL